MAWEKANFCSYQKVSTKVPETVQLAELERVDQPPKCSLLLNRNLYFIALRSLRLVESHCL